MNTTFTIYGTSYVATIEGLEALANKLEVPVEPNTARETWIGLQGSLLKLRDLFKPTANWGVVMFHYRQPMYSSLNGRVNLILSN